MDVNNYRGITVLSCLCKLFTRIINTRLNYFSEIEGNLSETQFGFRKGRGTTDCIFILHGLIELMVARGGKLFCAFIDFEKCYDYLSRAALFYKLTRAGISSKCVNFFKSMYNKMKLSVKGDENWFTSNHGVYQGEVTSPIFFSLFISDLEEELSQAMTGTNITNMLIRLLSFADDLTVIAESKEDLQLGLDRLALYCRKWGLKVNTRKTKIVVFRKGGKLRNTDRWFYGDEEIEIVSHFKYLGCDLSYTGSFCKSTDDLVKSARRALFPLKQYCHQNEAPFSASLKLFNSTIQPILTYCCEIWGLRRSDPIEKFHLKFLKSMLCVKTSTPNCFVYGECGVMPMIVERQYRVVKYWLKIIQQQGNVSCIVRSVYDEMFKLSMSNQGATTWASLVRDLLNNCGMGEVWLNQFVRDVGLFKSELRQRLYDIYYQHWFSEVSNTSSFRLFKHLKDDFSQEGYLDLEIKHLRVAISKVRLSSHLFMVERGRWERGGMERSERKCLACNVVEDEFHCLFECPKFSEERRGLVSRSMINKPSMFKFTQMLRSTDRDVLIKIGTLCFKVMKKYKELLLK